MTKHYWRTALCVALLLGAAAASFAQKLSSRDGETVYVTKGAIKLRATPASKGFLFIKDPGKEVGTVPNGAKVLLTEKQVIETAFSKTIWVKVRLVDSDTAGWAYWGKSEEESVNFELK